MDTHHSTAEDARSERSRLLRGARIAVLLSVLIVVLGYAYADVRARRARTDWTRTLEIAVVVARAEAVDPSAIDALRARASFLEDRLEAEMRRYRPAAPKPFRFTILGPTDAPPPPPLEGEGVWAAARHALDIYRWSRAIDDAARVTRRAFDSRVYVSVRPRAVATRATVEGDSEAGGRVGTVSVELDADSADFALAVVAHEMLHTLGATDKYDADGRVVAPAGLAEPDLHPTYPQRFCEVMTRGRPVAPGVEKVPEGLHEIAVGPVTAAEIRWTP